MFALIRLELAKWWAVCNAQDVLLICQLFSMQIKALAKVSKACFLQTTMSIVLKTAGEEN